MDKMSTEDVIRVGRVCAPYNVWITQEEAGTVWHGSASMMLQALRHNLPPIQMIYNISDLFNNHPAKEAIEAGIIDMDPDLYTQDIASFATTDFSVPIRTDAVVIASTKKMNVASKVVDGAFSGLAYGLILAMTFSLGLVVWLNQRRYDF